MKKPSIEKFIEVLQSTGGNLTQTAKAFGVTRTAVYKWIDGDNDFAKAVEDSRGQLLDECIVMARIVALGIPQKDSDGKIIGWVRPPDPSMLRYLLSTLGRFEGFGEHIEVKSQTELKGSIPIRKWVEDKLKPQEIQIEIIDSREQVDKVN